MVDVVKTRIRKEGLSMSDEDIDRMYREDRYWEERDEWSVDPDEERLNPDDYWTTSDTEDYEW